MTSNLLPYWLIIIIAGLAVVAVEGVDLRRRQSNIENERSLQSKIRSFSAIASAPAINGDDGGIHQTTPTFRDVKHLAGSHSSLLYERGMGSQLLAEQRLYSYLFDAPSSYLKHIRPVIDHSTSVQVRLGVCLLSIDDIIEKDQTMVITGCVKMKWMDEFLRWGPPAFDNVSWIVLPSTQMWLPDVALVNSPDPFYITKKPASVELTHTGEAGYYPSGRLITRCCISLTYFPFDVQSCDLQFESWAYPVKQLELVAWPIEPVDMKNLVRNHQWKLDNVGVQSLYISYEDYNFSTIRFHFFFRRRSLYYTVYAIVPCFIMAALQIVSHTIPVEHPGRMGLLTSLFVSSSVLQSSITSVMPKSSDGLSLIQIYLITFSVSLILSIIVSAINKHIFYRTPDYIEPSIVSLARSYLGTFGITPTQKAAKMAVVKIASSSSSSAKINSSAAVTLPQNGVLLPKFSAHFPRNRFSINKNGKRKTVGARLATSMDDKESKDWKDELRRWPPRIHVTKSLSSPDKFAEEVSLSDDGDGEQSQPASQRNAVAIRRKTAVVDEKAAAQDAANKLRLRHAWLTFAAQTDRFFFYALGVINLITPAVLFLVLPAYQDYPESPDLTNTQFYTVPQSD